MARRKKSKIKYRARAKKRKRRGIVIFAGITILMTSVLLFLWVAPEWKELKMSLQVASRIGIDVSQTEITFGTVPPGGTVKREVIISNMNEYDKIAHFSVEGEIKNFVKAPEDIIIGGERNVSIVVEAKVPKDAKFGNYTGELKIFLRRNKLV